MKTLLPRSLERSALPRARHRWRGTHAATRRRRACTFFFIDKTFP